MKKLREPAWDALTDALTHFKWYKPDHETMVRSLFADAGELLVQLNFSETKRQISGHLVSLLRQNETKYQDLVIEILVHLSHFDPSFRHLARLSDGGEKVAAASAAHAAVLAVVEEYSELAVQRERLLAELAEREKSNASRRTHEALLRDLCQEFLDMHQAVDKHKRGRDFESFLNRLFELWDLYPRAAYNIDHEQIDGAFTFRTDDYILEARWWAERLEPKELNDFESKVDGKARNTLGLCIAVEGFTDGAVLKHSKPQAPLILMDGTDLMPVLEGRVDLDELLERKRRHAAETGSVMFRLQL